MKEITIFSALYKPHVGGVERYTEELSKKLVQKGYKVNVITSKYGDLKDEETIDGINIYRIPSKVFFDGRLPFYIPNRKVYKKLCEIVERSEQIILNVRFYTLTLLGAKLSHKYNKKVFQIEHGSGDLTMSNKLLQFMADTYIRFLTVLIKRHVKDFYGVSEKASEWLEHFNIKAKGVLHNSINTEYEVSEYKNFKEEGKTIISYVGRVIVGKGIDLLIEAFIKVNETHKDIKLLIAGDGDLLDKYKNEYANIPNVEFLGSIDYDLVMNLLRDSDIFVSPSMLTEGLPTTILEAAINKNVIIATPKGGTVEVVLNEEYGIIIKENSIEEIEKAIEKCLNNKDFCNKISTRVYEHVKENFNWTCLAEKIIKIMEE